VTLLKCSIGAVGAQEGKTKRSGKMIILATFRRKNDVSGIEVNGLPQNKTRRGERRA